MHSKDSSGKLDLLELKPWESGGQYAEEVMRDMLTNLDKVICSLLLQGDNSRCDNDNHNKNRENDHDIDDHKVTS